MSHDSFEQLPLITFFIIVAVVLFVVFKAYRRCVLAKQKESEEEQLRENAPAPPKKKTIVQSVFVSNNRTGAEKSYSSENEFGLYAEWNKSCISIMQKQSHESHPQFNNRHQLQEDRSRQRRFFEKIKWIRI